MSELKSLPRSVLIETLVKPDPEAPGAVVSVTNQGWVATHPDGTVEVLHEHPGLRDIIAGVLELCIIAIHGGELDDLVASAIVRDLNPDEASPLSDGHSGGYQINFSALISADANAQADTKLEEAATALSAGDEVGAATAVTAAKAIIAAGDLNPDEDKQNLKPGDVIDTTMTRDLLYSLDMNELRKVANPLGLKDISKEKLQEKVIEKLGI